MKKSLSFKFTIIITSCILSMALAIVLLNTLFLNKFYVNNREKTFEITYEKVNALMAQYSSEELVLDDLRSNIEKISAVTGIDIMVLNNDWSITYASMRDVEDFTRRLQDSLFVKLLNGKSIEKINDVSVVKQEDNYTIYRIYNERLKDNYLELIGNVEDGHMLYMALAIKNIEENVAVSNRFVAIIGIIAAILGAIPANIVGNMMAKPIKKISNLAVKMSELDFEAKYQGNDALEIEQLGNSMNLLSSKLEQTITELKTANVELQKDIETKEQIDNMRKEFLSNVSHELKTPIAIIQGYAEGLKEGITDDVESMEYYCDVIADEASKMNSMVKKLLSLNQLEFGQNQLEFEKFDIVCVINAIVNSNNVLATGKDITIELNLPKQLYVWADEFKIEEVITNYLTNAINHCSNDNIIRISATKNEGIAHIEVFNTGDNIPKEAITHVWEKFYKVDKARTREYGGSGIGLSIVKAIMEQHAKDFGVRNEENGVVFWFELDATD